MSEYVITLYIRKGVTKDYAVSADTYEAAIEDAKFAAVNYDRAVAATFKAGRRAPIAEVTARFLARRLDEAAGRGWYDLTEGERQARLAYDELPAADKARVRALQAA